MRLPDSWKGPYWEPRDIWIGLYWTDETREDVNGTTFLWFRSVYVCLIPCLPVRVRWYRKPSGTRRQGSGRSENTKQRLKDALRQIAWLADAEEPSSVKAAEIARTALGEG